MGAEGWGSPSQEAGAPCDSVRVPAAPPCSRLAPGSRAVTATKLVTPVTNSLPAFPVASVPLGWALRRC